MEFKYELENGCLTIRVPKELDHHCAIQLRAEADLLIDSYRVNKLVLILPVQNLWTVQELAW